MATQIVKTEMPYQKTLLNIRMRG